MPTSTTHLDSSLLRPKVPAHYTTLISIKPDKQLSFRYSLHLFDLLSCFFSLYSST